MNIHQIIQLILSSLGFVFIAVTCICKFSSWLKLKLMKSKERNEAIAKEKRKIAYLALKEEFEKDNK